MGSVANSPLRTLADVYFTYKGVMKPSWTYAIRLHTSLVYFILDA